MWHVIFTKQAAKDAKRLKAAGLEKKAKQLVEVVRADPFATPPAFEGLVGSFEGLNSRRISLQHRFVYAIDATPVTVNGKQFQGTVKVVRMWTHYEGIRQAVST